MASFKTMLLKYLKSAQTEHQQAILRLGIMLFMLVYLVATRELRLLSEQQWFDCMWVALFALPSAVVLFVDTWLRPQGRPARKVFGMFVDYGCLGGAMLAGGAVAAPFSMLLMWTTIGHGLRFGTRYLWVASGMATMVLVALLMLSTYWAQQLMLGFGMLLAVVAVPIYLSSLLNALTRAREVAVRASAAKTRFLANMSHEFRTPLNGIIGSAELLSGAHLSPEQAEYLDVIQSSSLALLAQVNDVLDLAAIEAGKVVRRDEDFSLAKLVNGVSTMLQPAANAKGLVLTASIAAEIPNQLHGDAAHLRQILINLVQNAVKFTQAGAVSIGLLRSSSSDESINIRFEIRDTGPGIPADARQRIFEAFEQGDGGIARKYGGTGLGMTIVRMLTQQLEGNIVIEDNPGGGACIIVELPFKVVQLEEHPVSEKIISFSDPFVRHRTRVPSLRILIADDQAANRLVLQRLLEKAGHRCEQVADASAMLDRIAVEHYDLVLLDLHMPDMSGIDALKEARVLQSGGEQTPFIAVSADVTVETIKAARAEGIFDFLPKPVTVGPLLDAIANVAGPKRSNPERYVAAPRQRTEDTATVIEPALLGELLEVGLGDEFVGRFVEDSLRDIDATMKRVRAAAAAVDRSGLLDEVHAMKGIATNVGALRLAAACSDKYPLAPGSNQKLLREYAARLDRLVVEVHEVLPRALVELRERQPRPTSNTTH